LTSGEKLDYSNSSIVETSEKSCHRIFFFSVFVRPCMKKKKAYYEILDTKSNKSIKKIHGDKIFRLSHQKKNLNGLISFHSPTPSQSFYFKQKNSCCIRRKKFLA